ncbi:MAG: hypothetical protein HYY59_06525 [Candidatus Omnitrophica bacterium]|nr:hypothetical protein [Candidatus Omnitrophota bacterium]
MLLASLICCLLLSSLLLSSQAGAQVPHLIRYQGQAVDSQGVPLEGPYTLTFRLYDAETGGTKVWEESQPNVALQGGQFSVLLGQVTPLTTMDWSAPRWLSVQVGTEPELTPRQRITSVPLAIRAGVAESANTATVAASLTVPITTSTITDDANKLVPSGAVILWTGAGCPAGYTRLSALDGKFLVADTAYQPAAGGSNTKDLSHTHSTPSHTHANTNVQCMGWNAGPGGPGPCGSTNAVVGSYFQDQQTQSGGGGQTGSGGSAGMDVRPAFATVLMCQKT